MIELERAVTLSAHTNEVWCVSWNPRGNLLASCGEDRIIYLWSDNDGKGWHLFNKIITNHTRTIRNISWSPCGNFIASASFDGTTCIWESSNNFELVATLDGHESEVKCVDWSISGSFISTCSRDKSVWIWEVCLETKDFECVSVLHSHTQDVKKVKWHPIEDILFSISYDNLVKAYASDVDGEWGCIFTLEGHTSTIWGLAFNRSGNLMVTCSDDKSIILWAKEKNDQKKADGCVKKCSYPQQHTRPIYDISWCKDGNLISSAGGDNAINIYEEQNNELKHELALTDAHLQDVNSVAWNPTIPNLMASCSDDSFIKLWFFKLCY